MNSPKGEIITFYSYKGGAGRTMAVANIACLLADKLQKDGGDILMVDWDLNAPGLHRYFGPHCRNKFPETDFEAYDNHPGLIDLFLDLKDKVEALPGLISKDPEDMNDRSEEDTVMSIIRDFPFEKYIIETDIEKLFLLKAGRFDQDYKRKMNVFDWREFYNLDPHIYTLIAEEWSRRYQYVLIDARTGYSDMSNICTALMPEKLVLLFTPNHQSLTGIRDLALSVSNYRRLSQDLRPLTILPLPARVELSELDLRYTWRFGDESKGITGYQPFFKSLIHDIYSQIAQNESGDSLINLISPQINDYFDSVQIQYLPRYAYGEEIAIIYEKTPDNKISGETLSLSKSYERFCTYLLRDNPWVEPSDVYHEDGNNIHVTFIDQAIYSIGAIHDGSIGDLYRSALLDSLGIENGKSVSSIDFERPFLMKGPREIAEQIAVQLEQLYAYHIFLDKLQALQFLGHLGYHTTTSTFVRRRLSRGKYEEVFKRKISVIENRRYIFTYAEILILARHPIVLRLPSS